MKASEFMAGMEQDGCIEVGGPGYCLSLYTLADSVRACHVLEIGLGWGYSGRSFCASIEKREPAMLTSVDPEPPRKYYEYRGAATWAVIRESSENVNLSNPVDILYLDGDPKRVHEDFAKFYKCVQPCGLVIIDGYGSNDADTRKAVDELNESYPFILLPYSKDWAHAVHRRSA